MPTPPRPRLGIKAKVLIPVLAGLILLPLSLVGIVETFLTREQLDEGRRTLVNADTVFQQLLDGRQQDLMVRFRNLLAALNGPVTTASLQQATMKLGTTGGAAAEGTIRQFLSAQLEDFENDSEVMLFLPEGSETPVGARRGSAFQIADFSRAAAPIWQQALKGEPTSGRISAAGTAFFVVSAPVRDANGRSIGVLTMGVRIRESALEDLKKLTHTEIVLVADNQVIGSTLPELDSGWLRQVERPAVGGIGAASSLPIVLKDQHYLAFFSGYGRTMERQGFDYVLLSSMEESLRMQQALRRILLEVSLAAVLLGAVTVWIFIRRFVQPLRDMRGAAEAVARGDFSQRVAHQGSDESGELAEAFNHMSAELERARAEAEKSLAALRSAQIQQVQSEKLGAIGQFVAGVAHELNNPLTAVIGFADLLSQTSSDEKTRPHLEMIAKSAHRCHSIVQNLLGFARQHTAERSIVKVNASIEEVLEIMAYDLRASNIRVVKQFQADVPAILADPHQLQQVFVNILRNARQAIQSVHPEGQITVRTWTEGSGVGIEFADNGPGIAPENLTRIFEPFFTTKAVGKGTGLGLSLSHGIIQEHGGEISAASELGRGAVFTIKLPAAAAADVRRDETEVFAERTQGPAAPSGKSILVVDDEEWILALAKELLTADGHMVETVSGGEKGIEALRRREFDVIVCDWRMPGLNGVQFFEHLMSTDPVTAERVLFMSGDVVNQEFREFLKRHSRTCLAKPFAIEDFQKAVAKMLGTKVSGRN